MAITMSAAKLKPAPPEPLGVLRGHRVPVNTVSYVNSSSIISGAADGVVKLWNLKTRRESASASAHSKAGVLHTQLLDGARFVTQGRDGFVKVWDTHTFSSQSDALSEFYCGSFSFTKLATLRWPAAAASDAQHLIVCPGSDSEQLLIYDTRVPGAAPSMLIKAQDPGKKKGMCMSLSLFESSANGHANPFVAAGYEGGQLSVLDLRAGGKIACEAPIFSGATALLSFDLTRDGQTAICGSSAEDLRVAKFDPSALSISSESFFSCNHGGISAIRIRPDQRIFASAGWDHRIRVFHQRKLKPLAILKYHTESVFGLDFSPDNAHFVSASKDHKIALWSLYPPATDKAATQSLRQY